LTVPREPQLVICRRGLSRLSMKSEERDELVGYVSDLGSLLDLEISLDGDSLNIGLDGTSIAVLRLQEGWAITCENYSEGVRIRIWGCEAEFYRDSRPYMRGLTLERRGGLPSWWPWVQIPPAAPCAARLAPGVADLIAHVLRLEEIHELGDVHLQR
jgi:hypothetical protein